MSAPVLLRSFGKTPSHQHSAGAYTQGLGSKSLKDISNWMGGRGQSSTIGSEAVLF
nr:hypothetical protein [Phormidesmis priestleyi]